MSCSELTPDEEILVTEFIVQSEKFINKESSDTSQLVQKSCAVKFLMARKFDLNRALRLYEAHCRMRSVEDLCDMKPSESPLRDELDTGKFTILSGCDHSGAKIAMFTARLHHPGETTHSTTLQGLIYQLDTAMQSIQAQRNGLVFVYDMTNSKYSNFDYKLSEKILTLLKGAYPARLRKVLIVTAPLWFKAPFQILRLFVREKLRDRVWIINLSQLCAHVPRELLPLHCGGPMRLQDDSSIAHCFLDPNQVAKPGSESVTFDSSCQSTSTALTSSDVHDDTVANGIESPLKSPQRSFRRATDPVHSTNHEPQQLEQAALTEPLLTATVNCVTDEAPNCMITHTPCRVSDVTVDDIDEDEALSETSGFSEWDDTGSALAPCSGSYNTEGQTMWDFVQTLHVKGRAGLSEEYATIRRQMPMFGSVEEGGRRNYDSSLLPANRAKNRYMDVLCADHSRVRLTGAGGAGCVSEGGDYINANYVDGYLRKRAYISTQGPLPATFADFWRMVWEQGVHVVVMTTRLVEHGQVKCGRYWPLAPHEHSVHGHFTLDNVEVCRDNSWCVVTRLLLTDTRTGETRDIVHFLFTTWPDFNVPHSASDLLQFLDTVRDTHDNCVRGLHSDGSHTSRTPWSHMSPERPSVPPIVVHCSAGIGRTGTFCTVDICTRRLQHTGTVDVHAVVSAVRQQRAGSIQTADQYVFCHLALLEFAHSHGHVEAEHVSHLVAELTQT